MPSRMTRRQALAGFSLGLGSWVAGVPQFAFAAGRPSSLAETVAGLIAQTTGTDSAILNPFGGGAPVTVRATSETRVSRGIERRAALAAFQPGEGLAAIGQRIDDALVASQIMSIYHVVTTLVRRVFASTLDTTAGSFTLTGSTWTMIGAQVIKKPPTDLQPGNSVELHYWVEPGSRQQLVLVVAIHR